MTQRRVNGALLKKHPAKIDAQSPTQRIYVFRCDESGLYAFTADREGRMLPSQISANHLALRARIDVSIGRKFTARPNSQSDA